MAFDDKQMCEANQLYVILGKNLEVLGYGE